MSIIYFLSVFIFGETLRCYSKYNMFYFLLFSLAFSNAITAQQLIM